jgi:protein-tyrosine-phosphatase
MTPSAAKQVPFRVLLVCTHNQFRSPLAEHLLRKAVTDLGLCWTIVSAGTQARPGLPMNAWAANYLRRRGIAPDGWMSRRLQADLVRWADLILAAEEPHRRVIVTADPGSVRRTFLLLQFARYANHLRRGGLGAADQAGPALLASALAVRTRLQPAPTGIDELPDPFRRHLGARRRCAQRVLQAIISIHDALAPAQEAAPTRALRPDRPSGGGR